MADIANSRSAPSANPIPFNPAAWLSHFRDVGGWWIVGADDRISFGWQARGSDTHDRAAHALWCEIANDQTKRRDLWDTLLSSPVGHPDAQLTPTESYIAVIAGTVEFEGDYRLAETRPNANAMAGASAQWQAAMDDFDQASGFEEMFRKAVYRPFDAAMAGAGGTYGGAFADKVADEIERLMDMANDTTDEPRRAALRTPASNISALRWKLDQLLTENVMSGPFPKEIEQVLADVTQLVGGDHGRD